MTKANRQEIIEIARSWKGTRWQHQGCTKHLGADCEGFIEGVFREAGYIEAVGVVRNWRRREDGSLMLALLETNLDLVGGNVGREPVDLTQALPADLLAFCDESLRTPDVPRHLGLYVGQRHDGVHYVIHSGSAEHGVIEHRMDQRWLRRTHSVWKVRGIIDG